MHIAGFTKSSLINYPKHASAVIFIGGCNFRCGYCHNPEVVFSKGPHIDLNEILLFLKKRKRFLDGVCITGGEPTIADGLEDLIKSVKAIGYDVKLDTNGSRPEMIEMLIANRLLDYVAMDIKGPLARYDEITGVRTDVSAIETSIDLLMTDLVDFEFRTTVYQEKIGHEDIKSICERLKGGKRYFIQNCRKTGTDSRLMTQNLCPIQNAEENGKESIKEGNCFSPCTGEQLAAFKGIAQGYIKEVQVR